MTEKVKEKPFDRRARQHQEAQEKRREALPGLTESKIRVQGATYHCNLRSNCKKLGKENRAGVMLTQGGIAV